MKKLPLIPLIAFAWLGYAQATIIEVPQGSGVFPTIGQVDCLEELGSGRYCAATYECSGATSPVANGRDCVVTVDAAPPCVGFGL